MGLHEAMVPLSFVLVCIVAIAMASINIQTYLSTNKTKDSNFNFSAVILALSIVGLGVSGYFAYAGFKLTAAEAAAALASDVNSNPDVQAARAANAQARSLPNFSAADQAVPTTEMVKTLATPDNVRATQQQMDAELDKLIAALGETKQMKNTQLQARLQGLIAAAQAMAAANTSS